MAAIAVAISLAVMILAVSISDAFEKSIQEKVYGFWGHIQMTNITSKQGVDEVPLHKDSLFTADITLEPWLESYNTYALKPGIIKTDSAINGTVLKGISLDANTDHFKNYLIEGSWLKDKNHTVISQTVANKMKLKVGDKLKVYFIQEPIRSRALTIVGIYNTNLIEFDEQIAFVDISHIQKLNGWDENMVSGVEIFVDDADKAGEYAEIIRTEYADFNRWVQSMDSAHPQIFDWLNVIKINQKIVLTLMSLVAIINMMSMLLVIILERTNMIGILKALGARFSLIRNIFLNKAAYIILWGLIFGNLAGIGLAWLQIKFEFIKLDPKSYYLSVVPVEINWPMILLLNIGTMLIILLSLLLPSFMIRRVNPIKAIRFK